MERIFNKQQCSGCGNCIHYCPKNIIYMSDDLNNKGNHYVLLKDENECLKCGICELMCTASAVHMSKNSSYDLIDLNDIPKHAGCHLGLLSKAIANAIYHLNIKEQVVLFKRRSSNIALNVETYNYDDENYYEDALEYKKQYPDKLVLIVCGNASKENLDINRQRFSRLTQSVTIINTVTYSFKDSFIDCKEDTNFALSMKEASYVVRGSVHTVKDMIKLQSYIEKALKKQLNHDNYSIIDLVHPCFYRLNNRSKDAIKASKIDELNEWFINHIEKSDS